CFYVLSMKNTGIADSLLIQGTAPVFIIIIGRFFLKDPLSRRTLIAIIGVTAGFLSIFLPSLSGSRLSGNVFGLIKALAFALTVIALRKLKDIDKLPATAIAAIIACCISLIFMDSFRISHRDLLVLQYFGIIQTGLAFILFSTWSGYVPSTMTGIIVLLESVLGPLWVWLFFNEKPANMTFIGGVIIIASLVFNSSQKLLPRKSKYKNSY
ncbi:MAG TPA: hypothetical protein DCO79_11520, partial [Spirochaeta sp.]|nr:hypothetical protein [Spirochaeta sp.]